MTWQPSRRGALVLILAAYASPSTAQANVHPIILRAAHLLDVETGRLQTPGEVRVEGERIVAVGTAVEHSPDAEIIDLGGATLMPGLIDAHVHLFLHPGDEDLQTVEESVPKRTLLAMRAAHDDLMGGFTAERDMGTEGAGSADTAIRDAIDSGLIVGPRLRISGNAVDILGGHEDANHFNPAQHVLSNADYANNADEIVEVIRKQHKEGSDFVKIYETGHDTMQGGVLHTPYQYTAAELKAAVDEAARWGGRVAVHAMGEPGTLYAARAGVASIDHATQLSAETMRLMKAKGIYAVPTFTVFEYFARPDVPGHDDPAELEYKIKEFKKADRRRHPIRRRLGRGTVPARHPGPRARAHGEVRHETARGAASRSLERRAPARLGRCDRRTEARLLCRHRRGSRLAARGHHGARARLVRHEGRGGRAART